jgi:DNA-binding transcriptional MerR regulator
MDSDLINEKTYYTIGEVSRITDVKDYTIRLWEKNIGQLTPLRKSANQRRYTKDQIDLILKIKKLIREKKLTLQGAKKHLNEEKRLTKLIPEFEIKEELLPKSKILKEIRDELKQVLELLKT